jgi:diaminopimelate decarboxylase
MNLAVAGLHTNTTPRAADEPFSRLPPSELKRLALTYGTPLFVLDERYLRLRMEIFIARWKRIFPHGHVYYSYKTNYLPEICRAAYEAGMGADAVSGYELEHARKMCPQGPAVFNGPMKTTAELKLALDMKARINIDCEEEIDRLSSLCQGRQADYKVGLRVNPGAIIFSSEDRSFVDAHAATAQRTKFGWPIDSGHAARIAEKISAHGFQLASVHCHLGSQITDQRLYLEAIRRVVRFVKVLRQNGSIVEELNIGGGFGVPGMTRQRRGWWSAMKQNMGESIDEYQAYDIDFDWILASLKQALLDNGLETVNISCEPGRYIVSNAMFLLTTVVGVKHLDDRTWLLIDGGQNLLPTAAFGERRRTRFISSAGSELSGQEHMPCWIGGPLCFEGDTIMQEVSCPRNIAADDFVVVSDAGAYTVSRSTNFNRARAPVVSIGDSDRCIWAREEYDDIFALGKAAKERVPNAHR